MSLLAQINTRHTVNFPTGEPDVMVPTFENGVVTIMVENLLTFVTPSELAEDVTINLVPGKQLRNGARVVIIVASGTTPHDTIINSAGTTIDPVPGAANTTNVFELIYLKSALHSLGVFYQVGNAIV